jgi:hypothetical protein
MKRAFLIAVALFILANVSFGQPDNAVSFYCTSPDTLVVNQYIIYPIDLTVYSDEGRTSTNWTFFVEGNLLPFLSPARLVDGTGQALTTFNIFQVISPNSARVTFSENIPLQVGPNCLRLQVFLGPGWGSVAANGQFSMIPATVQFNPAAEFVWPEGNLLGSYVQIPVYEGLFVSEGEVVPSANIIAGTSVPMLNLNFQSYGTDYTVNALRIRQSQRPAYNRSVESVEIVYQNIYGQTVSATQQLSSRGIADFNISGNPLYVPLNSSRTVNVNFYLRPIIGQVGAFTGDLLRATFPPNEGFQAVSGSGQVIWAVSGEIINGNTMVVRGNVPVFNPDVSGSSLVNGPVDLYRWQVLASPGGTDISLGQLTFWVTMVDAVITPSVLYLANFQVYEGTSYETATALQAGFSGTDAYLAFGPNGQNLSSPGNHLFADTTGTVEYFPITVTFYDDRLVPPGGTKCYILRAIAGNVNTGASSNDGIFVRLPDIDETYLPPLAADFNPEMHPGWGAVLDERPNLLGGEFGVAIIWSDMTGTYGNYVHTQASWYEPSTSSLDFHRGFLLPGLGQVRFIGNAELAGSSSNQSLITAELPAEISIANYPNPFNPATTIRYQLPVAGDVTLSVFDIAGQKVAELVNGWREVGNHQATFNGANLASGIYIYRIQAGDFIATNKMMLVK